MRRIIYSFILLFACVFIGQAQISNWQGVLRDSDNKPMVDQNVRLRFTINQAGSSVYSETHQAQTSGLGLIMFKYVKERPDQDLVQILTLLMEH